MLTEVGRRELCHGCPSDSFAYYGIVLMCTNQCIVVHTEGKGREIAFQMYLEEKDTRNNCIV